MRSEGRHEVPVGLQRGLYRGVPEAGLDLFEVRALLDHEGRGSVPEVVESCLRVEASSHQGGLESMTSEIAPAQHGPGDAGEHELRVRALEVFAE